MQIRPGVPQSDARATMPSAAGIMGACPIAFRLNREGMRQMAVII